MAQMHIRSYSDEELAEHLCTLDEWKPFPKAVDRSAWQDLLSSGWRKHQADEITARCRAVESDPWPYLSARRYMDFKRNGNRDQFEKPYFERRSRLMHFALAEASVYTGEFLDALIDGIWAICEETTWCLPAHAYPHNLNVPLDVLPRQDRHIVDLFASQTAYCLAMVSYLLGDALDAVSPRIRERMHRCIRERVVDPVIDTDDFHWLAFTFNWNPWCSGNTLGAAMFVLEDHDRLVQLVQVVLESSRKFYADQLADGGCSEGPGYWGVSPGMYLVLFDLLHTRSGGYINLFEEELVQKMGHYIRKVHLDERAFATFADCPHDLRFPTGAVYRYGGYIQDEAMQDLALYAANNWHYGDEDNARLDVPAREAFASGVFHNWFWLPNDLRVDKKPKPLCQVLPDLQVWHMREQEEPLRGLVLACKGGHNGEFHNHNDVGHFIALADGHRFILDVGTGTYTQKNFSATAFDIWYKRGQGHNAPVVNGFEQVSGGDRRAKLVHSNETGAISSVCLDLTAIYPAEAGLELLERCFELDRNKAEIRISDRIVMREQESQTLRVDIHLLCADNLSVMDNGIVLTHAETQMLVASSCVDAIETEGFDFSDDAQMHNFFADRLRRVIFRSEQVARTWNACMTLRLQ